MRRNKKKKTNGKLSLFPPTLFTSTQLPRIMENLKKKKMVELVRQDIRSTSITSALLGHN